MHHRVERPVELEALRRAPGDGRLAGELAPRAVGLRADLALRPVGRDLLGDLVQVVDRLPGVRLGVLALVAGLDEVVEPGLARPELLAALGVASGAGLGHEGVHPRREVRRERVEHAVVAPRGVAALVVVERRALGLVAARPEPRHAGAGGALVDLPAAQVVALAVLAPAGLDDRIGRDLEALEGPRVGQGTVDLVDALEHELGLRHRLGVGAELGVLVEPEGQGGRGNVPLHRHGRFTS